VGFGDELGCTHIRNPELYGAQALATKPLSVLTDSVASRRHTH
jgi:hypothetical protein